MTVVTYAQRYKKKPVALEVPAVVRAGPTRRKPAAEKAEGSQKSAIVTIRKRGVAGCRIWRLKQRRGDAAEAIFREMKRRIAATRQGGA